MILTTLNASIRIHEKKILQSVLGLAGGLALVALIFEGFSLDTCALPRLWIIFGLLTAASTTQVEESENVEQE
ncbi:MAG: hypothetical protein A2Z14_02185 [Chloroflexi bacterium RBG_16_48_8]|nr:MAG: hypothetical protein A2Z14_02185 [Chloroflexi bacterium RBG_16_48_8]